MSYYRKNRRTYPRENKYDKSYNSIEKIQEQILFKPNDKFLLNNENFNPKIENFNKNALPYYPLPSNEGYESFLKVMKKDQYIKTQYSLPFMFSLKDKYKEKPMNMKEIKIPQKNEIRSRAKIVTEEAYRVTRNYLDENSDKRNFSIAYITKNELSDDEVKIKTKMIREMLNKICYDNYDIFLNQILKFEYDEKLLEIFKNLIFTKILTEKKYFLLYVNICIQMCKLYNKKTYSNEPKMNLKSLLLISIQKEFLSFNETNIQNPFVLSQEEKIKFIINIKQQNIRLISELYLCGFIPKKIIYDCINELINKTNFLQINLLCLLILNTYKKLLNDGKELLDIAFSSLEKIYHNQDKKQNLKTKFLINDILDLKNKISNDYLKKDENELSYSNTNYSSLSEFPLALRKNSEVRSRRKSSINPKDVEYIHRSRFNSRADELKSQKEDNNNLMDELVSYLETDIDFYQCFRLTEEEFDIIKNGYVKFIKIYNINNTNNNNNDNNIKVNFENINLDNVKNIFDEMMDEVQCEKFIAIGHLLEIMFSLNNDNAEIIMNFIIYFFKNKFIDEEDIKHGIVLGLVNFKNNIIDYPNTKEYFQKFINLIKENNVLDEKILKVYQRCCDNMEKFNE